MLDVGCFSISETKPLIFFDFVDLDFKFFGIVAHQPIRKAGYILAA
jgi:hypothetical protein